MVTRTADSDELLGLDRDSLLEMLRWMLLGRRLEEKAAEMYQLGEIGGFCHLYMGQEAVAVGAISVLQPDDYVITAYRDHVQALVRGMEPKAIMAELFGRIDGCSKGKGGSMHLFDASNNFLGGHAIVGSHLPLAVGVGYAIRYRDRDAVCVCFLGDSVPNIGSFSESLNMAALWDLPIIFVIENNGYGMGTAVQRAAAVQRLADRACGYEGMPGWTINGQDVLAVRQAIAEAVTRARADKKPTLIEANTYRYMGHSMSDPIHGHYRTKEEVQQYRVDEDPIKRFSEILKAKSIISDDDLEQLDSELKEVVEAAVEFARNSPAPEPDELYTDIYAGDYPDPKRRDPWR